MEITVVASGSNGNSCLVEDKNTSLLIDAGKSLREIESRLNSVGKSLENIDALLITHSHIDHIRSAGSISRRFKVPLYMSRSVSKDCNGKIGAADILSFSMSNHFKVGNLRINPVKTSHDVPSCGFVIGKFGLFTDTGIITEDMKMWISKLKAVLLESNHDIDMLIKGRYPWFLKNRILSDQGHLCNIHSSELIQAHGKNLSYALLGHLSGNNNTPELVKKTFETLVKRKIDYSICSRDNLSGVWDI